MTAALLGRAETRAALAMVHARWEVLGAAMAWTRRAPLAVAERLLVERALERCVVVMERRTSRFLHFGLARVRAEAKVITR